METFPGSFPGSEFNRMSLREYSEAYALAVKHIEARAEAMAAAGQ